ncbi:MAG: hypothetical protein V1831_00830 [Candidatus Woesearchaeota archaeon]
MAYSHTPQPYCIYESCGKGLYAPYCLSIGRNQLTGGNRKTDIPAKKQIDANPNKASLGTYPIKRTKNK